MVELGGYTLQEVAYEGHETRVWRAIHDAGIDGDELSP